MSLERDADDDNTKKEGKGEMSSDSNGELETSTMEETGNRIIKERTGLWPPPKSVRPRPAWSVPEEEQGLHLERAIRTELFAR